MIEWLGISHLFELSPTEAIAGFLTPLAVMLAFFIAQMILPARKVPGYVINAETGEPRNYRLNGLLVFVIALIVWGFELTGLPRDWFYRSSIYAVAGGTVLTFVMALLAVYTQPAKEGENSLYALWDGRIQELSLFNERFDFKMYGYVVGGAMLALNALSGAAYHYETFGSDANPGVYLYAALFTFYITDYFIFERVQLYTFDIIHERMGFKVFWGGLIVYGWMFILPLWGMAAYPHPGFSDGWTYFWLIGTTALFAVGWGISRGANMQKYSFKRWPDRKFLGIFEPQYIEAGERKILCSGFWGASRHMNYFGEILLALAIALSFGYFTNLWAWSYFVFIVGLFIPRERFDSNFCEEKYGAEKWAEYQRRVKYRIVPGIY